MVGLNPKTFGYFILICMLSSCTIIALGLCISAMAPSVEAANAMTAPFLIVGILFGGFYIRVSSLPIVLNWIPYVSAFRWAFEALCVNEFKGETFNCNLVPSTQCLTTGEQVLATLDFDDHKTDHGVFGLGMLWIAYLVWLYLLLELKRARYTPLGYIGAGFKKYSSDAEDVQKSPTNSKAYEKVNQSDSDMKPNEDESSLVVVSVPDSSEISGGNDETAEQMQ
jgi:hypothetical protein